jgi:predicted RNase H-like HicB family nuclease
MGKSYLYTVVFDNNDNGTYAAKVPMLPGCKSEGKSVEEAEANIKSAIASRMVSLTKEGRSIPEEKPIHFPFVKAITVNYPE